MKTKIYMGMPEAAENAIDVEITAVAVMTNSEYDGFFTSGRLPERFQDRMEKYTAMQTKASTITGCNAMLCCAETGAHGVAVCGKDYVHSAGLLGSGAELLNRRIDAMADYYCELSRIPGRKNNALRVPLKKLSDLFQLNVTADNGVGELLARELREREEITDIILNEDCLEISYALDFGNEALDTPGEWMNLMGLIGCNLHDVHLLHTDEEHDLATIADLTPGTLTAQGKKDWADVLNAKVENISHGYYGTQIDLSGCDAERIRDFSYMLAGDCPLSDYDKWVTGGIRETPAMLEAEAVFKAAMEKIEGADGSKTPEWLDHAWTLAVRFAGENGVPHEDAYPAVLKEFAAEFANVDRHFEECAYEIYNCKAAYSPGQLYPIADWISGGGSAKDAFAMWGPGGEYEGQTPTYDDAPGEDESQGMTLQ